MEISHHPINIAFVEKLQKLNVMYSDAAKEAIEQNLSQRQVDWAEWLALDSESQKYILDYLQHAENR